MTVIYCSSRLARFVTTTKDDVDGEKIEGLCVGLGT
jgi:hypothetical protein